jgi:hypothetical protein
MDKGYCYRKDNLDEKYRFEKTTLPMYQGNYKKVWVTNYNLSIDYPNGTWGTTITEFDFLNNYIGIDEVREEKLKEILNG